MREHVITQHEADQRLDRYLRKLMPRLPLGAIFKHLRQGSIRVDGRKVEGDLRLQRGMHVQLLLPDLDALAAERVASPGGKNPAAAPVPPPAPLTLVPPENAPRIVRKEEAFLVIAKPAGLAVHGGSGIRHSVIDWLASQRVGVRTSTWKPAPAHRIDRGTSGLLLIGLVPDALRKLTGAFRDGKVTKLYHAVVTGVPKQLVGSIVAPLFVDAKADRRDAKVLVDPRGQPARTDYEVVRTERHLALLKVTPKEGRQHQIRAHLAHLGHPILGDRRYGSVADTGKGFLLHCSELTFPHPASGKPVHVVDPLPRAFTQLFAPD